MIGASTANNLSSANYKAYEDAFNVLNARLFDGKLPAVVLTLRAKKGTHGYAWKERFVGHDALSTSNAEIQSGLSDGDILTEPDVYDEIAINPATASRSARDVLGTLLHEMVHVWQFRFGKPSRNGYHNAQWANKMIEVGLVPFNVKDPASMTGQACSHTIEEGGAADTVFTEIMASFGASLVVELPEGQRRKKPTVNSKVRFTCSECGANAWGKASLYLICGDCGTRMEDENADLDDGGNEDDLEEED